MAEQLAKTSRGLDSAVRAHNDVVASFDGKLLNTARRMGERGVAGADELAPPAAADVAVPTPVVHDLDAVTERRYPRAERQLAGRCHRCGI